MAKPQFSGRFLFNFLSLLCFFTFRVSSQSSYDSPVMQKLKTNLKIPSSLDWSDPDPCKWAHVACENQRITRIQIPNQNITGTLPVDLKELTKLNVFEVIGQIPSLAGLNQLQKANFLNNNFTYFPSDFFTSLNSLTEIYLDNNHLEPWFIPKSIKETTSLKTFSANNVSIQGRFPGLFNMNTFPGLIDLHVSYTNIEGELPTGLVDLMIQSLWVNGNSLNKTIQVLQNMSCLQVVWMHGNKFSGPLPDFSMLTQLRSLSLRDNQLTGVVPLSLINLKSLYFLNLTNNKLQGPTPKFSSNVTLDMISGRNSFCLDEPGH